MSFRWAFILLGLSGLLVLSVYWEPRPAPGQATVDIVEALAENANDYRQVTGDTPIELPRDHGPHHDFKTEWWYYTGNVSGDQGDFGYQLTFFRTAYRPPEQKADSAWSAHNVFMAHFTLSGLEQKRFHSFERFSRETLSMAGAEGEPLKVWLHDWSIETRDGLTHLSAEHERIAIDLTLEPGKAPVLQGKNGFSRKGAGPGVASYYYSQTRLPTRGTVTFEGASHPVEGFSWMDHEWSSQTLAEHLVGWDWFSLQLEDNTEVMAFRLRREDEGWDPFNAGCLVASDGSYQTLKADDFLLEETDRWTSPASGVTYPSGWRLSVGPRLYQIEPALKDQELDVSVRYWEGSVRVTEVHSGTQGRGYVELVGYGEKKRARRDSNPQPSGP